MLLLLLKSKIIVVPRVHKKLSENFTMNRKNCDRDNYATYKDPWLFVCFYIM